MLDTWPQSHTQQQTAVKDNAGASELGMCKFDTDSLISVISRNFLGLTGVVLQ